MKRLTLFSISLLTLFAACKKEEPAPAVPNITHATGKDSCFFTVEGYLYTTNYVWFVPVDWPNNARVWDFGDGETSTQDDTMWHMYKQPGTYTVKLTVNGVTTQQTITITDGWKQIGAMRNWTKKYSDYDPPTFKNRETVDTTFALQAIDFNTVMLIKDDRPNFKDTMYLKRELGNELVPTNAIVYKMYNTKWDAKLIWYRDIDSVYVRREYMKSDTLNLLEYMSKK